MVMRLCSILYNKFNYAYLVKNQRFVGPGARPIKPVGRRAFKISGFRAGGPPVEHSTQKKRLRKVPKECPEAVS